MNNMNYIITYITNQTKKNKKKTLDMPTSTIQNHKHSQLPTWNQTHNLSNESTT